MKLTESIRPASYLRDHTVECIQDIYENRKSLIITHHGEPKAMMINMEEYESMQETIAMLKILSQSSAHKDQGSFRPADDVFEDLHKELLV